MAKKQRTVQLPEEIFVLADEIETRTGARFNRQLLSAMLQWIFTSPQGPHGKQIFFNPQRLSKIWMEAAVAVERGDISVGEVPKWLAQRNIDDLENFKKRSTKSVQIDQERLEQRISVATAEQKRWHNIMCLADDPIAAILAFWKRMDTSSLPYNNNLDDLFDNHDEDL